MFSAHFSLFRRWQTGGALLVAVLWFGLPAAEAQIQVDVRLSRRTYILYEPLIATVSISNNAGRDITMRDDQNTPWLSFDVSQINGGMVQPYEANYSLPPLTIPAGKTLEKKVDLSPMFPIREMGTHRVRVSAYFADTEKFYYSTYATFDLTDGRLIWRQSVGVPGSVDDVRQVSLMTHQLPNKLLLYLRVRDEGGNNVYTTQALGRMIITGRAPQQIFDRSNTLHVMQESMPGIFLYTAVDINGRRLDQKVYVRQGTSRPILVKMDNGEVGVRGGHVQAAAPPGTDASGGQSGPKLSDRPSGLPGAAPKGGGQ